MTVPKTLLGLLRMRLVIAQNFQKRCALRLRLYPLFMGLQVSSQNNRGGPSPLPALPAPLAVCTRACSSAGVSGRWASPAFGDFRLEPGRPSVAWLWQVILGQIGLGRGLNSCDLNMLPQSTERCIGSSAMGGQIV